MENIVDDEFRKIMQSNTGCAVVMAGSDSDEDHISAIAKSLEKFEIPYRVRICSAHKQPVRLMELITAHNEIGGSVTYVAVAGGTDALSGTASYHTMGPVVSCPPDAPNQSCLTNPPGSSNAYVAKAGNVGKFIAQIYAGVNPRFRELLEKGNGMKISHLEEADRQFCESYGRGQQ